jgi:hypothetical protein
MSPTATPKTTTASLFDVSDFTPRTVEGRIEMVALDELELASNPRKEIDQGGTERLARMLASMGQLVPLIGQRVAEERVLIWAASVASSPPAPATRSRAATASRASRRCGR